MSDAGLSPRVERGAMRQRADDMNLNDDIRPPTPEQALEDAQRTIADQAKVIRKQDERLTVVELTAAQQAEQARLQQLDQQGQQIDGQINAASGLVAAAKERWKAARTAGDENAEADAVTAMTDAQADLKIAKANKGNFDRWKTQQIQQIRKAAVAPVQTTDEPSPEVRKWMADHPLFFRENSDYRADAMAAHEAALLALGADKDGTAEYVQFVDSRLEKAYGKGHGQLTRQSNEDPVNRQTNRSSFATPPSRGGSDFNGRGEFTYEHPDGSKLTLTKERDEKSGQMVDMVRGTMPAEWREFARINRMSEVAYATEQMRIQQEMATGGETAGLNINRSGVYK